MYGICHRAQISGDGFAGQIELRRAIGPEAAYRPRASKLNVSFVLPGHHSSQNNDKMLAKSSRAASVSSELQAIDETSAYVPSDVAARSANCSMHSIDSCTMYVTNTIDTTTTSANTNDSVCDRQPDRQRRHLQANQVWRQVHRHTHPRSVIASQKKQTGLNKHR